MQLTTSQQYKNVKIATEISTEILNSLSDQVKVGITPLDIDKIALDLMNKKGVKPAFRNVIQDSTPFPKHICVSVNNAILHGIPEVTPLQKGDIVKIDMGIIYQGYYTDQCFTFVVENFLSEADKKLVNVARLSVETAVKKAKAGNTTGDIGYTMHSVAKMAGLDTLKHFVAHGIGTNLHELPEISTLLDKGEGEKLKEGQLITVECQVAPTDTYYIDTENDWTVYTQDGSNAAMFEYMVIVREQEPEILTPMQDWDVIAA